MILATIALVWFFLALLVGVVWAAAGLAFGRRK